LLNWSQENSLVESASTPGLLEETSIKAIEISEYKKHSLYENCFVERITVYVNCPIVFLLSLMQVKTCLCLLTSGAV
jgi:hypothetical protein